MEEVVTWIRQSLGRYRRRLGEETDDLAQEVLVALTRDLAAGRFRGEANLRTLCRVYVDHKCIDRLRYNARRDWVDLDAASGELPRVRARALDDVLQRERNSQALSVIREMPEECRQLWRMILDGLDYREMSRRTGISPGALRVRVSRCRSRAREALAKVRDREA